MPLKERERGRFYLHHQFIGKKKKKMEVTIREKLDVAKKL